MASSVSVVIPSYNLAPYLGEAVRSARAQTRPPLEIIVVDDCSTDDSAAVARALGVTVLETEANAGAAAARNRGIAAARGDLVAFLDADDAWEPGHLATLVPLLEAHPGAVLASSAIRRVGARSGTWQAEAPVGQPFDALHGVISKAAHPVPSTTVVPRAVLLAAGGFDEDRRVAEDYELWMRLALRGPFVYSGAIGANYRCHPGQITVRTDHTVAAAYLARQKFLASGPRERPDLGGRIFEEVRSVWLRDMFGAWTASDVTLGRHLWRLGSGIGLAKGVRARAWEALWALFPAVLAAKRAVPAGLRRRVGHRVFGTDAPRP